MQLLDERELRGVIGHELSHVYNRDILISCVAGALAGDHAPGANWPCSLLVRRRDDDDGPNPAPLLLIAILGPLAAGLIQLADQPLPRVPGRRHGATLTRDPLALAVALRKLEYGTQRAPLPPEPQLTSAGAPDDRQPVPARRRLRLFSTHPPMEDRIRRLEQLARR